MAETNPFDAPSALPNQAMKRGRLLSVPASSIVGGLIGLAVGAIGIVVLFFAFPGVPGVTEIMILLLGILIILVLPSAVIGAILGLCLNYRFNNEDL